MPTFGRARGSGTRIYRRARFGRNVDLVLLDQRQYRADQPCGDKQVGPPCPELNSPRPYLGDRQMGFVKKRLAKHPGHLEDDGQPDNGHATVYPGGNYIGFDPWQGYPQERTELLRHIQSKKIKNVVFITGDIHTFIAGDVRIERQRQGAGGHRVRGRVDHLPGPGRGRRRRGPRSQPA